MSHTETYEYFGLNCADGGKFYICEDAETQFIGCCTSDPCGPGNGTCPDGGLRASSFSTDAYEDLPTQDCDDARGTDIWYSCKSNNPPFMGCCAENACGNGGCSRSRLVPAKLSENEKHRLGFLEPDSHGSTSTAASTSSTLRSSLLNASETDDGDLGTGAITGIAVGATAAGLLLLVCLVRKFWWQPRKRKQEGQQSRPMNEMAHQPDIPSPFIPDGMAQQSPMNNYQLSTPTIVPYYSSGVSSRDRYQQKDLPQTPQFEPSQSIGQLSSNDSILGQNRGSIQLYDDAQMTPVWEMDGTTTVAQELDTEQEHSISQNQSLNTGLGVSK